MTGAGRYTAARRPSRRTRTGATSFSSTSISTGTTARDWAPAIRPAGPGSPPGSCTSSRRRAPRQRSSSARPQWDWRSSRRWRRQAPAAGAEARMGSPDSPALYQINTRTWLTALSRKQGQAATLDDIPDAELDRVASMGFDWVWLLSVWQTGRAGREESLANPE